MCVGKVFVGSSPRVRGKPAVRAEKAFHGGLIPACAGKTSPSLHWRTACSAHPRVCGENIMALLKAVGIIGSSPRVRGKLIDEVSSQIEAGLIPACAGKTPRAAPFGLTFGAHPRVCGENQLLW